MLAQSHAKMSLLNVFGLGAMGKGGCYTAPINLGRIDGAKQFPNFINRQNSYVAAPVVMQPPIQAPKKKKKRRRRRKNKAVTSQVARQRHCSEDSLVIVFDDAAEETSSCDSLLSTVKKVRFADDLCAVHNMVTWSFAYQAARKGNWEECARDRCRFNKRIQDTGDIIKKVLEPGHRNKIYEERFAGGEKGCDN